LKPRSRILSKVSYRPRRNLTLYLNLSTICILYIIINYIFFIAIVWDVDVVAGITIQCIKIYEKRLGVVTHDEIKLKMRAVRVVDSEALSIIRTTMWGMFLILLQGW
jgi:hypothetical protein